MKIFEEFTDIETRKEIKIEQKSFEIILNAEDKIIAQYKKDPRMIGLEEEFMFGVILKDTRNLLKDQMITQEDLQGYLDSRENTQDDTEAKVRGLFSGALLQMACERSIEYISLEGRQKRFNYLFYRVQRAHHFSLQNICGDRILQNAGQHNGLIRYVALNNISGNFLLSCAGEYLGEVEKVIATRIKGVHTLSAIGSYDGTAADIVCSQIKGDYTLAWLGTKSGLAKNITAQSLFGYDLLNQIGQVPGRANNIFTRDLSEDDFLRSSALKTLEQKCSYGNVHNFSSYEHLSKQKKEIFEKIMILAEKITKESAERRTEIHDEIANLQNELGK